MQGREIVHRSPRTTAAVAVVAAALSLTACGAAPTGSVTDIEDIYNGAYDAGFYKEIGAYARDVVTVFADVDEVISPNAFVIAGIGDTDVQPLLVVSDAAVDLSVESTVAVTGTVRKAFSVATVEKALRINLDEDRLATWQGQPYIDAAKIDTSVEGTIGRHVSSARPSLDALVDAQHPNRRSERESAC